MRKWWEAANSTQKTESYLIIYRQIKAHSFIYPKYSFWKKTDEVADT